MRAAAIAATEGGCQGVFVRVLLPVSGKESWSGRGVFGGYLREAGTGSQFEIKDDSSILTLGLLPLHQVYMRGMEKGYDAGVEDDSMDTESDVSTPSDNPED